MDARSSSLIVGLYVVAALVIAAAVGGYVYWQEGGLRDQLAREAAELAERQGAESAYLSRDAMTRHEYLAARSAAEAERLRQLLDEKTKLLDERTATLRQRTAEYQNLQKEFDAAAALVLQTLNAPSGEAPATDGGEAAPAGEEAPADGTTAMTETTAVREELEKARLLEAALSEEVEQLQAEVLAAETEITRLQRDARAQTEEVLANERLLREVASETLVRIGEPAIPALIEALGDENPAVRRWAALVLADVGPAPTAVGPLMEALADRDETVRTAAAQALRAVTARE